MEQERVHAFELEKIRMENNTKATEKVEIERAIAETEAAKETKRMRLHAETAETELEAKEKKTEKLKYETEKERLG